MADHTRSLSASMVMQSTERPVPPRRPSLLPAFEPLSSSPGGLPRTLKRKLDDFTEDRRYYPTPVPTSSTGILASSSPTRDTRPELKRTVSTLSERAPLGDVPTLDLPANGEPVLMGRSSNSSDYQLSANRHISRVHVRASYHAPTSENVRGRVEVECLGWNGAKVHCRGEIVELAKNEVFVSDRPLAQILVDVQDTRVMLVWPKEESREPASEEPRSPWTIASPSKRHVGQNANIASSPPPFLPPRPVSPTSPTPRSGLITSTFASTFHVDEDDSNSVQVYEDHESDEDAAHELTPGPETYSLTPKMATPKALDASASQSSLSSEPDEFSEHDEENDPIIHSFGPGGENILSRFQSFQPTSPEQKRSPLGRPVKSPIYRRPTPRVNLSPVKNHVINQLAFSRVHSIPLSTIHSNLPAELRGVVTSKPTDSGEQSVLSRKDLKSILDDIACVGEISREGKDAAGKLLENEFYYVPEMDTDEIRRQTVTQSLGKTSIRAARKQHKQYYWKRPRH